MYFIKIYIHDLTGTDSLEFVEIKKPKSYPHTQALSEISTGGGKFILSHNDMYIEHLTYILKHLKGTHQSI